jgi:putative drug exporter of the RND superfamily
LGSKLLERLRDNVIPPAERGTGAAVYVGGITAIFEDLNVAKRRNAI